MSEYRHDDQTIGYCPLCHQQLSNVTTDARGYCELHSWQWAEWNKPVDKEFLRACERYYGAQPGWLS